MITSPWRQGKDKGRKSLPFWHSLEAILLVYGAPDTVCRGASVSCITFWVQQQIHVFAVLRLVIVQVAEAVLSTVMDGPLLKAIQGLFAVVRKYNEISDSVSIYISDALAPAKLMYRILVF